MTNRQALELLEEVTEPLRMSRSEHRRVSDAITVLAVLVDKDEKSGDKKPE